MKRQYVYCRKSRNRSKKKCTIILQLKYWCLLLFFPHIFIFTYVFFLLQKWIPWKLDMEMFYSKWSDNVKVWGLKALGSYFKEFMMMIEHIIWLCSLRRPRWHCSKEMRNTLVHGHWHLWEDWEQFSFIGWAFLQKMLPQFLTGDRDESPERQRPDVSLTSFWVFFFVCFY